MLSRYARGWGIRPAVDELKIVRGLVGTLNPLFQQTDGSEYNIDRSLSSHTTVPREDNERVVLSAMQQYDRSVDVPVEGIATLQDSVRYSDSWHAGMGLQEAFAGADPKPLGLYVDLPKEPQQTVREAMAEFYHHPELTKAKIHQFDYGCKGAMKEFASTGRHMCMYRPCLDNLLQSVLHSQGGERRDIFLDGWTGSGKSMSLYSLASAARASGWIVMYVPSAALLVRGGVFKKKDDDSHDPFWYTPVAAQAIMKGLQESHKTSLESMPSLDQSKSLGEECTFGLETKDDFAKVDSAIRVMQGLLQADGQNNIRTLVILDDYNYLYHRTEYHETMHRFYRRRINPEELKLAAAFRLLETSRDAGTVAAACSYNISLPPNIQIPLACPETSTVIRVPRFSMQEASTMCSMLTAQKKIPSLPPDASLKRAVALTNGNAKEMREKHVTLFSSDCGLPLSL